MTFLHYGSELSIQLDPPTARMVTEAIGAHATRGGWVTTTDVSGRRWSFLVSAGIPIWLNEDE
jgi:hypothetical protein